MALSIRDILILDYFDGKPVHHKIPPYKLKIYGQDANDRIGLLYENGWIRYSRPQETVSMLPDKALSDFLKRYGLSGEGSHAELTGRVISRIPESDYAHGVPKIYVLTKEGKAEIGHHMAYVLNVRENYGLTEGEIGESQNTLAQRGEPYTARDILYRAFQQKISLYIMAGEWSKLRNMYYTVANFYLRIKDNEEALPYLYLVFFMDMSGMGNKNNLVPYENLFPTQKGMILLMDEIRNTDIHRTRRHAAGILAIQAAGRFERGFLDIITVAHLLEVGGPDFRILFAHGNARNFICHSCLLSLFCGRLRHSDAEHRSILVCRKRPVVCGSVVICRARHGICDRSRAPARWRGHALPACGTYPDGASLRRNRPGTRRIRGHRHR